jgi:hypothetical protein
MTVFSAPGALAAKRPLVFRMDNLLGMDNLLAFRKFGGRLARRVFWKGLFRSMSLGRAHLLALAGFRRFPTRSSPTKRALDSVKSAQCRRTPAGLTADAAACLPGTVRSAARRPHPRDLYRKKRWFSNGRSCRLGPVAFETGLGPGRSSQSNQSSPGSTGGSCFTLPWSV